MNPCSPRAYLGCLVDGIVALEGAAARVSLRKTSPRRRFDEPRVGALTSTESASETERRALLRAHREKGDVAARDRLIEELLPFARSLARRYAGRGELTDDLEQVTWVGLIKAIETFDLDRNVELMTYVFPTVVGELKRHFRDRAWSVTVP